jgi:Xaa-Pro dipeptidase
VITEWDNKIQMLRTLYQSLGSKGLVIEQQLNQSWLFQGRSYINVATVMSIVDVCINDDAVYLIANNIETKRLLAEEWDAPAVHTIEYPWYEPDQKYKIIEQLTEGKYVTDTAVGPQIQPFRLKRSPSEQKNLMQLSKEASECMEAVCLSLARGMSEHKIAGLLAMHCMERGIEPIITLVAADERIRLYRHPLPTDHIVNHLVMVGLGARRNGLCTALTRFVAFGALSDRDREAKNAVLSINDWLYHSTSPGATLGQLFEQLKTQYRRAGFAEEWKLHHQGGLIGYLPREIRVMPESDIQVEAGQVFAWNPSITGYKAEDTWLIGDSAKQILTETPNLPYMTVSNLSNGYKQPDVLIRNIYR